MVQIDRIRDGSKIHAVIKEQVNHKTVPAVFIKGEFIGGCDQVKSLHAKGKLTEKINIHSKGKYTTYDFFAIEILSHAKTDDVIAMSADLIRNSLSSIIAQL